MIKEKELIIRLIENMLHEHDCIIIPHFGGFVIQSIDFKFDVEKHAIYPQKRTVAFNEKLKNDDGFLTNELAIHLKLTNKKSQALIEDFTKQLKATILKEGSFTFGNVGIFSLNDEQNLQFSPYENSNFNLEMFGLGKVDLITNTYLKKPLLINPTVISQEKNSTEHEGYFTTNEVVKSRKGIKNSVYAAILFLFAGISTFVLTEPNVLIFTSSLSPMPEMVKPTKSISKTDINLKSSTNASNVIESEKVIETPKIEEKNNHDVLISTSSIELIAGSFLTEAKAQKGIEELATKGLKSAYIIPKTENQKFYRISIGNVESMESGYLKALEVKQKNKIDIWVFENNKK